MSVFGQINCLRTNSIRNVSATSENAGRMSLAGLGRKARKIASKFKNLKKGSLNFLGLASKKVGDERVFPRTQASKQNKVYTNIPSPLMHKTFITEQPYRQNQESQTQAARSEPAHTTQEALTVKVDNKPVKTINHRDSEGRPTSKLYGHLFSIAGKGLNSSSMSSSLTEMTSLTHKYAESLKNSKPEIAEKYEELSNLFSQAQRWYNNPETALSEIKATLTEPNGIGGTVKSSDNLSSKGQGEIIPGSKALLTIGTRGAKDGRVAGHAMQFEITGQQNNRLSITVHNTGGGVEHNHVAIAHPDGSTRYSTERDKHGELIPKMYQTYVVYNDIAADDLDEIVDVLYKLDKYDLKETTPHNFTLSKPSSLDKGQDIFDKLDQVYSLLSSKGKRQPHSGEFQPPQPDGFCGISTAISFAQHFSDNSIPDTEHFKFLHAAREQVIADTLNAIQDVDTTSNGELTEAENQLTIDKEILDEALNILEKNESFVDK